MKARAAMSGLPNVALTPLSNILRNLMQECAISESELARQTGLPQTTVNRLLLGGTTDPRAHTLKPIADFFGLTIGQLCGFEPLPQHRMIGTTAPPAHSAWRMIPIIDWSEIKAWMFKKKNMTPLTHTRWVSSERNFSEHTFALYSLAAMSPRFRKGSILIVDPKAKFKEGHYILVALEDHEPTLRSVIIMGNDIWLRTFDKTLPPIQLTSTHHVYGTIVESRLDTYNE